MNNHIFICKQSPYEEYCNIANVDHNWNSTQREYWDNAWELVGPCELRVVVSTGFLQCVTLLIPFIILTDTI